MRARKSKIQFYFVSAIVCTLFTSACGLFSKNDAGVPGQQSGVCSSGDASYRDSFKSTLHPSLQKACYECHNSQSPKAPSPFADDSPSIAMESAKRFVDLKSPANSAFVKRMEQGHNCGANCGALATEFAEKIDQWKTALGGSAGKLTEDCSGLKDADDARVIRTAAQTISTGSLGTAGQTLLFDLKDGSPSLPGVAFQVRVRPYTAGTYIIDRPVLASQPLSGNPEQNVRVSNIHILINGVEDDRFRNFVSTDFVLQPRAFPQGSALSGWYIVKDSTQMVNWSNPAGESLAFEIKVSVTNLLWNVPRIDIYACRSLEAFGTFYNRKRGICLDCHDNGGAGYPYFPMKPAADAEVCKNFKMRANPDVPEESMFYKMSQNLIPTYRHPVSISYSAADVTAMQNWLVNER